MSKERPMLLSSEMVKSTKAELKTKTRRILTQDWLRCLTVEDDYDTIIKLCPYGIIGDILWVREMLFQNGELGLEYSADKEPIDESIIPNNYGPYGGSYTFRNIPSIHMPKWAARIWLEITNIKVERLHDITEEDAIAEGILEYEDGSFHNYFTQKGLREQDGVECLLAKGSFQSLWCSINGIASWDSNPYVWVISFKVLSTTGRPPG